MALSNYTELKTAIVTHSTRDDISPLIDEFILMAEEDMFSPPDSSTPLKLRSMESLTTTTINSGRTMPLPSGYQQMRRVRINDGLSGDLVFRAPNQINISVSSGRPLHYTITDQIEFDRAVDGSYEIEFQYVGKPEGLTISNPTNSILTDFPKIYLYGALYHAMVFAQEDARAAIYLSQFVSAIRGANKLNKMGRFAQSGWSAVGATP